MRGAIFLILAVAILATNVASLGVVSDYLVNNSMGLKSGESKTYGIRLQNPTENEIGIKIDYDKNIMKLLDETEVYILKPKESGYRITFSVTAPMQPGFYTVGYTVSEVQPNGGGGISVRLKINKNFNLKVTGRYNLSPDGSDKTSERKGSTNAGKEEIRPTAESAAAIDWAPKPSAAANKAFAGKSLDEKAIKYKAFANYPPLIVILLTLVAYIIIIKPKKKIK